MKKKEIKKTKLKPRKKVEMKKDQLVVILEDMRYQFGVMSEGFLGVRKEMKELNKKVDDNHRETNDNFKTLFKFRNETNDNFKSNFEYLSKIDDELQLIKIEVADLKVIFKGKTELKRVIQMERQIAVMQEQIDTMMVIK